MKILVIGGGITGLAAAHRLRQNLGEDADITVAEHSNRLGGRLATGSFAGYRVEAGAESLLATRDEAVGLARDVGLGDQIVHPASVPAGLVFDGQMHDLPAGTFMGIPADPADVAGLVETTEPPVLDRPVLGPDEDVSVGELVRAHYGDDLLEKLVTPLLGGVYAGDPDRLSAEATMPALVEALRRNNSVPDAIAEVKAKRSSGKPVKPFASIATGLSTLVTATAAAGRANIRLGLTVREIHQTPYGWEVLAGPLTDPVRYQADAVVLATPAEITARLLREVAPSSAAALGTLGYASIALATFAFDDLDLPDRSGFLVAGPGMVKASTFMTRKWPHIRSRRPIVRVSLGRAGMQAELAQAADEELVQTALAGLAEHLGQTVPEPVEVRLDRHSEALPQYAPGHVQRVARLREELRERQGIAVAGASVDGIGIAACIASGRDAADEISSFFSNTHAEGEQS
ncbi:protoporphyrinogen oxidase [Salininema proteolyticum]|uniref:Coproporphyrinogen III oxidase n=1 Tax=Salininema proteolyticum TaxID=1607685 RepID=A0ABV8U1T4_9ACTN